MGYVYFTANKFRGVIYVGVTSDLLKRAWQHKDDNAGGFTAKYNVSSLVYYEVYESIEEAIKREKQLKNWKRDWKIELIEKQNPEWVDLYHVNLMS